jgi:hypothetical protein
MTALKQYQRLESGGLWRAASDGQRRDVTVSFGDATLVLSDNAGRPLTHWSLPAIERLNPGDRPALFSPDPEAEETLEVEDGLMIDAIEKVRKSILRSRPRPRRLRYLGLVLSLGSVLALGFFWLPGAMTRQTLSVVPPAKRSEIGATLLGHIQRLTGPTCRGPLGTAALGRLKTRLLGRDAPGQIVVVPSGVKGAVYLPGGIIVIGRELVENYEDPAVASGYILAAVAARNVTDPLGAILVEAGLGTTFRLLTTGDIPAEVLRAYAEILVSGPPRDLDQSTLPGNFDAARVPTTPFAYAVDPSGESTLPLIEADPMAGVAIPIILSDSDWVSLQGICAGG